jgi:L-gulono-1,4-lactone dehydrogenase
MASEWRNWTGDQHCSPAVVEQPRTLEGLIQAVRRAADRGLTIHAAGSGHSFTEAALTDGGAMIRIEALNRVLDADPDSGLVKVEAGITLRDLSASLWERGLAMENLGDIDRQTLAGAISTATHGTGAGFRNLSAQVEALELVLADGSVLEVSEQADRDAYRAARVGLGALGVIYSVTLRAVPGFILHRVDSPRPLEETLAGIDELAAAHDHFEFFVFPYTDTALTIERNRVDGPPRPRGRVSAFLNEIVLENYAMDLLSRVGRLLPSTIPRLVGFAARQFSRTERTDRSYRIFASERRVRFTEMEYAIPRQHGPEAVRRVLSLVRESELPVGFPIEFRLVAPDDALLSPAHERQTAYVAVHQYQGAPWEAYFRAVERIMSEYEGRPHWGKRHFQTAETLEKLYPRWRDFREVRARLDPEGRFSNAYTDRVLGPVRSGDDS